MMKNLFVKRNEKAEEVFVIWNESIFKGKKRSEILEFKEKYRKIALQRYKAMKKLEKIDEKALKAMNAIANGETKNNNLTKSLPIIIGGVVVATVVATNSLVTAESATNTKSTIETEATKTITVASEEKDVVEAVTTLSKESYIVEDYSTVVAETTTPSTYIETALDSNKVDSIEVENTKESYIADDIVSSDSKETISEDVLVVEDVILNNNVENIAIEQEEISIDYIENDFVIFDQALELGMERCESIFDGLGAVKEISVLDIIEKAGEHPIVKGWFEMLLDTNINNEVVKYQVSYVVPQGAVSFNSREGKFFADIDTSMVEARIDLDLQHLIDASIKSGVDERTRDLLLSTLNNQTQVINILQQVEIEFEKEEINSGAFLKDVKNTVEKELTDYTTWDVIATFK